MTKDRLAELIAVQSDEEGYMSSGENSIFIDSSTPQDEDGLLEEEMELHTLLSRMQENVEEVKRRQSLILLTPKRDENMKKDLEYFMSIITSTANEVRSKLKKLEHHQKNCQLSAYIRMQKTQHLVLTRKFVDIMMEYNKIQLEYKENCKNRIKRQLDITGRQLSDDEMEEMLEQHRLVLMPEGIDQWTLQARETLIDLENRHADIVKLEKAIKELHSLFMDMAILIENQGEVVDRVEYHMESAENNVKIGGTELNYAHEVKPNHRKKKFICLLCLVTFIFALFLISTCTGIIFS